MKWRRRRREISFELAACIAGQVAAGLARHAEPRGDSEWEAEMEEAAGRARASLMAIGLMVGNAADEPHIRNLLALADSARVETS